MQYLREIFKGVTIDLAIRSYSVLILCLLYIIFAWIFAYLFSSPGQDLNVIFYQNMPNLHNRLKEKFDRKTGIHVKLLLAM
jgi:hypothetical protein